jgi:hypothetical protein
MRSDQIKIGVCTKSAPKKVFGAGLPCYEREINKKIVKPGIEIGAEIAMRASRVVVCRVKIVIVVLVERFRTRRR